MGSARLAFVETSLSGLGGSAMRLARSLGVEVVFGILAGSLALIALAQPQSSGPPGRMREPW